MNEKRSPKLLPYEEFLKTFENAPRAAISLAITNKKREILLTKRGIEPEKGKWHLPGSFILKDEPQMDCIERIKTKELGIIKTSKAKLLGIFDDISEDFRGHVIDIIYGLNLEGEFQFLANEETQDARFFSKLPKNIGFNHRDTLEKLGFK